MPRKHFTLVFEKKIGKRIIHKCELFSGILLTTSPEKMTSDLHVNISKKKINITIHHDVFHVAVKIVFSISQSQTGHKKNAALHEIRVDLADRILISLIKETLQWIQIASISSQKNIQQ